MFWSKDHIIERLSKIPRTLEDVSIEIFEGLPSTHDFLHRVILSKEQIDCLYTCRILQENVTLEEDLMYPYMDGTLSHQFAIHPTQHRFILPYEISGRGIQKEYRLFKPDEMKRYFPFVYSRLTEMKYKFRAENEEPASPDCYRLEKENFLRYMNTPKIIVTNHYSLQAVYDPVGNHIFTTDEIGIVLGDPSLYHYLTAVLNSSVSRVFPEIWNLEKIRSDGKLYAKMIERFPVAFPEDERIETLISTICRYQIYLNRQKSTVNVHTLQNYDKLIDFFKRISDLLILDTYLTNDLDPKLLEILAQNITSPEEEFEYSNDMSLLIALETIKRNILDSSDFRKCKFSNEFTNILATIKNDCFW